MSVLIDSSDFEALATSYFERAAADGVMHSECLSCFHVHLLPRSNSVIGFFDPQAHIARGVSYDVALAGFMAARRRAESELGISSELILCLLRHLPAEECASTFDLAEVQQSIRRGDITGLGLDSSENGFPPHLFAATYGNAKVSGLRRTAHAGEEGPPSYISSALDDLGVERIDHGIRLAEDPLLLKRVAEQGTLLTICPMSNVFLRCVSDVGKLPIRAFLEAGVSFSLNSDDPAYFGGNYILDNFCAVHEAFDLSIAEWEHICRNSIRGSWCSDNRKSVMMAKLESVVTEFSRSVR